MFMLKFQPSVDMSEESDKESANKSVSELFQNFKESLLALIPIFEKSDIPWRDSELFESFDEIAESLYNGFVVSFIEQFIDKKYSSSINFPKYGFYYKNYSTMSFIEVQPQYQNQGGFFVFLFLKTQEQPFDTVYCNKIDKSGNVVVKGVEFNFNEVKFRLLHKLQDGKFAPHQNIKID